MQRAAFPDLRIDAEDVLVSDDKVVTRSKLTGTHAPRRRRVIHRVPLG
jgi:hypothetical protein